MGDEMTDAERSEQEYVSSGAATIRRNSENRDDVHQVQIRVDGYHGDEAISRHNRSISAD